MFRRSYFGRGTGPIFFQSLSCRGTEVSILQCPRSFNMHILIALTQGMLELDVKVLL